MASMSMEDDKSEVYGDGLEVVRDEEEAFLGPHDTQSPVNAKPTGLTRRFWIFAFVNTVSTVAIVFVNKRIFEDESLRHVQVTFAALHFVVTAASLYLMSTPLFNRFERKKVAVRAVLPLAVAFILNVVLPNASLAFSSIQFYQTMRILVTPCIALLSFVVLKERTQGAAVLTLVVICVGAGVVTYFETKTVNGSKETSSIGVIFAFTGLLASAIYNVGIKYYKTQLNLADHQLLLNLAPVSVFVMLYTIPFSDDVTVWSGVSLQSLGWIALSCGFAALLNISHFAIIGEAGPVTSTVVGQFKNCLIFVIGWVYSRKGLKAGGLIGVVLAMAGILAYSLIKARK